MENNARQRNVTESCGIGREKVKWAADVLELCERHHETDMHGDMQMDRKIGQRPNKLNGKDTNSSIAFTQGRVGR